MRREGRVEPLITVMAVPKRSNRSLSRDFRTNGRRAVEEMFSYAFTNKNTRVIQHSFSGLKLEAGHLVV